jgi:alkylation response protein AidB-like acyl-CoA dehydrogenase
MDFELSKPQKMLQDTVREFLTRHCDFEKVRELMETNTAHDAELWEGLTDQGWVALTMPEEHEGLELGAVDLVAVTEAMGSFTMPGPFLSNTWAAELIAASGNEAFAKEVLPGVADGETKVTIALLEESASWDPQQCALAIAEDGGSFKLSGEKLFVPDAGVAELILVVGRLGDDLAVISLARGADGLTIEPMSAIDSTRKLYKLSFDGVVSDTLVARGKQAEEALHRATRLATVAVCGELVGGMQWVLDTTVEYAKTREQFGRVIGSYQAVQHHCADILYYLESARSASYYAAWAVSVDDPGADRAVSVAKAYCSDAAREVGNMGIQAHGGIGFTWEHDLQLLYKRAKSNEILFGDATFHRERIAGMVID